MIKTSLKKQENHKVELHEENNIEEANHFYSEAKITESSSKTGLPPGWRRVTFILKEEYINKLKAYAYWERMTLKDLIEEIIANYLDTKRITEIPPRRPREP